jgi:cell division septation protein DedD
VIWRWLRLVAVRGALRLLGRVLRAAVVAALVIAAAPASLVAAIGAALAWLRGWPPARLYRAALWCLPMVAVWLVATAIATRSASGVAVAPYHAWLSLWHGAHPASPAAFAAIAPVAIPVGLAAGGLAWAYRIRSMGTGTGGLSPDAAVSFDLRQWRHQARSARARIAAPGAIPLTTRDGSLGAGAVIRTVGHPGGPIASIPYPRMRSHQVVIGTTGTGKTTLLLRLWAGFMATALRRHAAGQGRLPLLVVLDCKGGADARRIADRARRALRLAGARSTAIWPDEASLSLWALPPAQLTTTLVDLIEHGTGAAAYYADVMEAVVGLAVEAPGGPPASAADFLARLDPGWLTMAYSSGEHEAELALVRSAGRQTGDIALRFRTLLRRLGGGLDGPGGFGDADAWYCILEGTAEISVAEAQARAIVDILASYATAGRQDREILLAVDEFSAVSRRLPVWQLYERARSLGLAVQVSAQSWEGLATDEDERYRIAATADGGIWLLRTPHPEPVAALAGTRKVTETTRQLTGRIAVWSHRGTSRLRLDPVVDPALIRALDVGQAGYIFRGGVTYLQVKRLVTAPAAVTPAATSPGPATPATPPQADTEHPPAPAPSPARAPHRLPDASSLLDDAFGAEPAP